MKIRCVTLGILETNSYNAPSGKRYMFMRSIPTEVKDKKDAEFFLKAGKAFEEVKPIKEAAKKVAEKTKEVINKVTNKDEIKQLTDVDLTLLNKDIQTEIIRKINGLESKVPQYETDRVQLILALQKSGNDIQKLIDVIEKGEDE